MNTRGLTCALALFGLITVGYACTSEERAPAEKPASTGPAKAEAHEAPTIGAGEVPDTRPSDRPAAVPAIPDSLPYGLLLAFSQFKLVDGKPTSDPGPARFDLLTREDGEWKSEVVEDTQSNIFHKAMPITVPGHPLGILTAAGTDAFVKLWHRRKGKLRSTTLWHPDFGGAFNRIRDAEVADLYGDGKPEIAVATHDQGVVAILRQRSKNKWNVEQIYHRKDTFVHEIEIGDLDADGVLEVYATPTPPNRLLAPGQTGDVVRFVPKRNEGPTVVAALGNRHAKEIYVGDVDGDGVDALYVPVEALMRGLGAGATIVEPVEIRRYDADTPADAGIVVAKIPDQHARFLTVGDVDGDGDGIDELYVADDKQGELRRYVWVNQRPKRVVIQKREVWRSRMTWNIVEFRRGL